MLLKVEFKEGSEIDKGLSWLKKHTENVTNTKAAAYAVENFETVYQQMKHLESELGQLRDTHGKLRKMLRERYDLDHAIRQAAEQGDIDYVL